MSDNEPLDLTAIEARLKAATSGPWLKGEWEGHCLLPHLHAGLDAPCKYEYTIRQGPNDLSIILPEQEPRYLINNYSDYGRILSEKNVDFIANAPTDIAALVAEVHNLRREVNKLAKDSYDQIIDKSFWVDRDFEPPYPDEKED